MPRVQDHGERMTEDLVPIPAQLELIPSSLIPDNVFEEQEVRGHFTGARLSVRDPAKYQVIASLLAENMGVKTVATLAKVSVHTVQAVREHEPQLIATLKERIAKGARSTARLCIDRLRDVVLDKDSKISARDLAIITGVLVDKAELLSGGATARVEMAETAGHNELQAFMDALRLRAAETDLEGENLDTKEIDVTDQVETGAPAGAAASAAAAGDVGEDPGQQQETSPEDRRQGSEPAAAGGEPGAGPGISEEEHGDN